MSKATVVVVDDSPVVLASVVETLDQAGYDAHACDNPILVAGMLRTHRPQVLLLDVDMPGLSGPQAVEILKRNDALAETRVLLFSDREPSELHELARGCGAVGAVPKGNTEALLEAVRKHARAASSTRLAPLRTLVFASDPASEDRLIQALGRLGRPAQARGTVGIDRAVREESPSLLVLESAAFPGGVERVVERLDRRGLLEGVAVVVVGEGPPHLPRVPTRFQDGQLASALSQPARSTRS